MSSDAFNCVWGDVVTLEYGKALRRTEDSNGGVPVFGTNGQIGWTDAALANGPGVILGRKGAYRGVHYSPVDFHVIDTAYFVTPKVEMDMRWLYYAMRFYRLGDLDDGSPIPSTTRSAVYAQRLRLPDIHEQRRIGEILGSFESKIELNREINVSLDNIARTLFDAMFANDRPRQLDVTKLPPLLASALEVIPRRDLSDPSHLPEGWAMVPLSSMLEISGGGTPKRKRTEYWGGDIPWCSIRDIPGEHDVWVTLTKESITQDGLDSTSAKLLRPGTSIVSARGTVGRFALTAQPMAINQSCYGINGADGFGDFFTYYSVVNAVDELKRRTHGSVFDTITRGTFDALMRARPDFDSIARFEQLVKPYLMEIRGRLNENEVLEQLRDRAITEVFAEYPDASSGSPRGYE